MTIKMRKILLLSSLAAVNAAAVIYLSLALPVYVYSGAPGIAPDGAESLSDAGRIAPEAGVPGVVIVDIPEAGALSGNPRPNLTLGELFILDKIFDDDKILDGNITSLGDIYILNQLFGADGGLANGRLDDIGNLLILNQLFGGESSLFGGEATLGNFFILDQLFHK